MKKKTATINGLAIFLLLSVAATSFAGVGTEAGVDIAASPEALAAAANYDYSSFNVVAFGTEAGTDIIASNAAKTAAANKNYDANRLAWVGTEAGYAPTGVSFDNYLSSPATSLERTVQKRHRHQDAICSKC